VSILVPIWASPFLWAEIPFIFQVWLLKVLGRYCHELGKHTGKVSHLNVDGI
jgi:hypothetical protein